VCQGCGGPLKIVAYVSDQFPSKRILDAPALSPPQEEKPPPTQQMVRVPVDEKGREIHAG
jgi:hypothetical protein